MSANQNAPRPHRQDQRTSRSPNWNTGSHWSDAALVAAAVVVGIAIRALVLSHYTPSSLLGDEADYLARGVRLARGGELEGIDRAPGYIFFIAAMAKWSSVPIDAVRWGQIALGALSTVLLFFVARTTFGTRSATAAAWIFALCPTFVGFSQLFYLETLYTCVLLAATLALLRAWETRSVGSTVLSGLLLGASALVKSISLPLALVFAGCWFLRERPRPAALRSLLFVAAVALVIFPYAWRNHARYGGWVLIDTSVSRTLWHANHIWYRPGFDWGIASLEGHYDGSEIPRDGANPARSHQELLRRELGFALTHPGLVLARIPEKIGAFWNPTSFVQRTLARDDVPKLPRESVGALLASIVISSYYAAVLFLGIIGLLRARRSPLRTCFLAMLGSFVFIHLFMVCQSRYRLALMPFFMIFAADAVLHRRDRPRLGSWRTWTAVALVGAMLVLWWPYLPYVLMQRLEAW
jgi:4-amino-4-deoxy-L-arabinose transferase-like glycosyltransferase